MKRTCSKERVTRSKSTSPTGVNSVSPANPDAQSYLSAFEPSAVGCPRISSSTGKRRMSGQFFDTEALLYILSGNPAKADQAEKLIGEGGMISVQVLNEVANVVRRKVAMSWTETHAFL